MKTRKEQSENVLEKTASSCCGPTQTTSAQTAPCCEQPEDGSSCCDKSETKEVNSAKTGCC